ncbi:extracellular solute-binding protein [Eisenbergiella massiliensis]|uniref:Extracellular solute-binding protein n=1 Tax=Eisenbergiella massiliensis TaxID=1720294 RepID=A0A3E3HXY3_9FIRM|nr:extracellular solute-binding protein [Eisenbergiella massiliensis]RGE70632.1 extracellular solute-binding protein [Eisenbergiella massiliensis]
MLAGCLGISCLAGCGNTSGGGDETSAASVSTTQGEEKTNGETVKLTALISKHSLTKDVNEMEWLRLLEEENGVDVEWQQITADWDQKKSVMFAGGDIPDILVKATVTTDFATYNGLFENLAPYIDEGKMPNVAKMFEDHPELRVLCTDEKDGIYGIPNYRSLWPRTNRVLYINQTWLDNLGLQVPTTMDELEEVLIAFKNGDPNGNGDTTDEIPLDFSGFPTFMLACFGVPMMNESDGYFVEDGKVKNYRVDERYKTFMQWLQKLYGEGVINEEVITQDYSKFQSLARGEGKTARVGVTLGWESGDRFGTEVADQYTPMPALKPHADSDESQVYWGYYSDNNSVNAATVALSANCKNKEAAVKFIDAFYAEDMGIQVLFGGMNDVDKCIQDNGDGTYTVLPPADSSIDAGTWKWTNSFADYSPYYIPDDMKDRLTMGEDMQRVLEERKPLEATLDMMEEKCETYPSKFITYTTDENSDLAMAQANINNIVDQTYSAWLTEPSRNIEEEWDAYVQSVYDIGLTQNLEIRQAAYERYLASME